MIQLNTLNPPQRQAVTTIKGPLMVLAGAGTGKTRVITFRIAHMMEQGISPTEIVALTFTNKAAKEMKERVLEIKGESAKGLRVGTFHSFCLFVLRKYFKEAGLPKTFSLISTGEQLELIRKALAEKNLSGSYKPADLAARISNAKNQLLTPEECIDSSKLDDSDSAVLAVIYELYERQLALNHAIDFDDCIFKLAKLLEKNNALLEKLHSTFRYFLVDEFQDTNFSQLYLLQLLASKSRNICVVGDDDQSIYSWRGAIVETLDRFEKIFNCNLIIKLEQNYRCTNIILDAANTVIKNNTGRKSKTLWSSEKSDTYITLASQIDDAEESKWIADQCFGLLGGKYKNKEIAILYRANAQSRAIELALRERRIQYRVYGGSSFFERKEVRDFLAYLKLTINSNDRVSFWRIINTPARGIGIRTLEKIEEISKEVGLSPFETIGKEHGRFSANIQKSLVDFSEKITSLRSKSISLDNIEDHCTNIIKYFGLDREIRAKYTQDNARQRKLASLMKLPTWIKDLAEKQVEDQGTLNLRELLDKLTLEDDFSTKEEKGGDHVSLMTIHAAKGLEFPAVFICGVEEELLPHKNSMECYQSVMEERRLFYVAITRAKDKLFISHARKRFSGYEKKFRKPSRFLKELPEDGIVTNDSSIKKFESVDDRRVKNIGRLSDLKNKLKGGFNQPTHR